MGAAQLAPMFDLSVAGMSYVLGGLWEALLCAGIFLLLENHFRTRWWWIARAAMCMWMIEGASTAVCRLPIKDITKVPMGKDLCDHVTGLPVTATLYVMYLLVLCWGVFRK